MTADDAAWSVNDANAATTPTSIHGQAGDFAPLFGEWKVIDKYTVEFPFTDYDPRWDASFLNNNGQAVSVLSKGAYDKNGEEFSRNNIVATGPFSVTEWIRDDHIVMEAVPNHWKETAKVKQIRITEVAEQATRVAMMKTGEADVAFITLKNLKELLDSGFKTASTGLGWEILIMFSGNLWEENSAITGKPVERHGAYAADLQWIGNPKDPADMEEARKVRHALAMAIDRDAINKNLASGLGWPNYIFLFPAKNPNFQDKWKVPYDPAQARKLISETAWPKGWDQQLYAPEFFAGYLQELADAVAGYWTDIGVKTTVLKYNYAIFRPTTVNRANTIPWITPGDEGKTTLPWDWPRGAEMTTRTRGGYGIGSEDPFVAQMFAKNAREQDPAKRIQNNNELADYMHKWMLGMGIIGFPANLVINPKKIQEWPMRPNLFSDSSAWERLKLVP